MFLKISQTLQENSCVGDFFLKRDSNTRVFFCETWETFKNNYFDEHLETTDSEGVP